MPKTIDGKPVDESKWNKAKKIAEDEGQGDNYAYITGVYKKMSGISERLNIMKESLEKYDVIVKFKDGKKVLNFKGSSMSDKIHMIKELKKLISSVSDIRVNKDGQTIISYNDLINNDLKTLIRKL